MAGPDRKLQFELVADSSKLDLDKPAQDMTDLGNEAADTATKVDAAFDKIAKSARTMSTKVNRELDDAEKEGLKDFKAEAASTGRESAASFGGGFEDVADVVQEVAANAFGGFGALGAAAGLAAAAGIGLLTKGLQDATERANAAKDRVIELAAAIRDAGGEVSKVDVAGMIDEWSDAIADNKSWWELWQKDNTTNLEKFSAMADEAGIAASDFLAGMSGHDTAAANRSLAEINARIEANDAALRALGDTGQAYTDGIPPQVAALREDQNALRGVSDELRTNGSLTEKAIARNKLHDETLGNKAKTEQAAALVTADMTAQQEAATTAEANRIAALAPMEAAIASVGQAEITRKDNTIKSVDEIIAAQKKEIAAKTEFVSNSKEVFAEVGQAGLDWANAQGPLAAQAMQLLADAPKAKQAQIIANYKLTGKLAGEGTAAGITGSKPAVVSAATTLHNAVDAQLKALGAVGIVVGVDKGQIPRETREAIMAAQDYADKHPVYATVKTTAPGHTRDT